MQHGTIVLRTMQAADFGAILAIQAQSYPANLIESRDALASRHALSPDTCWVAEHGGEVKGYVFAHPWHGDTPPQLNQPLARLPPQHDTLFIHDMALCRSTRGHGIAPRLLHAGRQCLVRSFIDGVALHMARPHGDRDYLDRKSVV